MASCARCTAPDRYRLTAVRHGCMVVQPSTLAAWRHAEDPRPWLFIASSRAYFTREGQRYSAKCVRAINKLGLIRASASEGTAAPIMKLVRTLFPRFHDQDPKPTLSS